MRQVGKVRRIDGDFAEVAVIRASACGENCVNCSGGCTPTENTVTADNVPGAIVGDTVVIEMATSSVLKAAFMVYILPIIGMITGYLIGAERGFEEGGATLCGTAAMLIVFAFVKLWEQRHRDMYKLIITRIIG